MLTARWDARTGCATGQDAFIAHVDSIPTSLLRPTSASLASSPPASPTSSLDLPALSPSAALAPFTARLTFLARYRDFFALYAGGARTEAAQLLVLLLTSGVAPRRFWGVMLLDAVPLLEGASLDSWLPSLAPDPSGPSH